MKMKIDQHLIHCFFFSLLFSSPQVCNSAQIFELKYTIQLNSLGSLNGQKRAY